MEVDGDDRKTEWTDVHDWEIDKITIFQPFPWAFSKANKMHGSCDGSALELDPRISGKLMLGLEGMTVGRGHLLPLSSVGGWTGRA